MNGWVDGWVDGWVCGWMDELMDGCMEVDSKTRVRSHFLEGEVSRGV